MAAAASVCKVSLRIVQAAKDAGCSAIDPSGRVDCQALIDWIGCHPETVKSGAGADSLDMETVLKVRAERQTREFKLEVLKGKYIPRDSAKRVFTQFLTAAKARSLSGVTRLVTLIRMAQDTASANEVAREEIMDIWREMARSEWAPKQSVKTENH